VALILPVTKQVINELHPDNNKILDFVYAILKMVLYVPMRIFIFCLFIRLTKKFRYKYDMLNKTQYKTLIMVQLFSIFDSLLQFTDLTVQVIIVY